MAKKRKPRTHHKRKPRREMIRRRRSKEKQITEKVISMRHEAHLIKPHRPFKTAKESPLKEFERFMGGRPLKAARKGLLSECFAKFEYDPKTFSLKVWFWAYKQRSIGGIYILWDIAQWEYEEFLQASSKGRHFYYRWRYPNGSRAKPYTKVRS